jgi:hypothetical protein
MDSQIKDGAWLAWIEQLAVAPASGRRENVAPRSLFHCRLDDPPDHLVPKGLLRPGLWEGPADRLFFVNPSFFVTQSGGLPAAAPTIGFAVQDKIAWVGDPGSGALQPFWLGPELSSKLGSAKAGDPAPSGLSARARLSLIMANLLVPKDYVSQRRTEWAEIVSVTGAQFQLQAYAPVGGLIHPFHVAALRRYYRYQLRSGKLPLGDGQSPLRYIAHNDPVARFFHQQLTTAMSALAGQPLKASYCYLASYQPGALLEKHTDREQCDFSISLCLDYAPEPCHATPWPLFLHKKSGTVAVFQAIGDALLYRGCEIPHSREPLPTGHASTSIFFHYVREDFAGSLD